MYIKLHQINIAIHYRQLRLKLWESMAIIYQYRPHSEVEELCVSLYVVEF
jgi:hypothetical protein